MLAALAVAALACVGACRPERAARDGADDRQAAAQSDTPTQEARTMRDMAVAGPPGMGFYNSDPAALRSQIAGFMDRADVPAIEGDLVAVLVPHAGYEYSGPVAAYAYEALRGRPFTTVLLLGNSHGADFAGAALSPDEAWATPFGPVPVDRALAKQLVDQGDPFFESRTAHAGEHCLEVQAPFLRIVLPDAKIVPLLVSDPSPDNARRIAEGLAPMLKHRDTVLVISSDLSHYPGYEDATRIDKAALEAILTLDAARIYEADERLMREPVKNLACTMCGLGPIAAGVTAAKAVGADHATLLKYANSGDTAPETRAARRCVGYGAVAFLAPEGTRSAREAEGQATSPEEGTGLTREDKARLLRVARRNLEAHFGLAEPPSLDAGGRAPLARETACFVTLKAKGRLRGCIGELEPRQPLIEAVADRVLAAALEDPRFDAVTAKELSGIAIEISAMSPLRKVARPEEIVVGRHGVVVRQGWQSGVFLPQVAPEQGWDRDTMLTILCLEKAGLAADAWKKGADLWVFTADVFGEEEFGLAP